MTRQATFLAMAVVTLSGCATLVHGPYQDVTIDSNPPGAKATLSAQSSERGPGYLDKEKRVVTTPSTVRLRRDNTYRVEVVKEGYKIGANQVVSSYDWVWAHPSVCSPCDSIGSLPTYDMSERPLGVRFLQAAFYEYPVGVFRSFGKALRIFNPDALLGNGFKLQGKDDPHQNWYGLGTPTVVTDLEPIS